MKFNVIEMMVNDQGDGFTKTVRAGLKKTKAEEIRDKLNEKESRKDLKGTSDKLKSYKIQEVTA